MENNALEAETIYVEANKWNSFKDINISIKMFVNQVY